ncbi:hypothetical protein HYH03_009125 [Edaphochlamys debaryana]|uniref:Pherophorin domain-containing protein n=1 Tax=Edaphochlamys debaryana TaxID=47281 RepID=A0A835XZZ4_9CHLO|nr:hypothetical protein HYH03_009125 [Edaphochlamys debaryana]|eukprot:KAG2492712.1 hypothetical protein HYH03_009125 [Edaphochlamys debaryana]
MCALASALVSADPAPGLVPDWCGLHGHASTAACASNTSCATGDSWWSDYSVCKLPGPAGQYPYNVSSWDVCGGPDAITRVPLVNSAGLQLGEATLYRLYASTQLQVAVTLGVSAPAVAMYRHVEGVSASLFLSDSLLTGPRPQYSYLLPAGANATAPFTCFTWSLDLKSVCDPLTSYQSVGGAGCTCYNGAAYPAGCPPKDLSQASTPYFSLQLHVSLAQPSADSCALDSAANATLRTNFNASSIPGTGQGTIPVGPVPTACRIPAPPPGTPRPPYPSPSPAAAMPPPSEPPLTPPLSPPAAPPPPPLTAPHVPPPPPGLPPPPALPPAPPGGPAATITLRSPLETLVQAEECSQAVMQLYPLYRGLANSFDCRVDPSPLGVGSDMAFTLAFHSQQGLLAFRGALDSARVWEGLLGALSPGCGALGSYADTLQGYAYDVCTSANQTASCRFTFRSMACAPPPLPPPSPPPPRPCLGTTGVTKAGAAFEYAACDALLALNDVLFLDGVDLASPAFCELPTAVPAESILVGAQLAGPQAAQRFLANANDTDSARTLALYLNLSCWDTIALDASSCLPDADPGGGPDGGGGSGAGRMVYTGPTMPLPGCTTAPRMPRAPRRPPVSPSPPRLLPEWPPYPPDAPYEPETPPPMGPAQPPPGSPPAEPPPHAPPSQPPPSPPPGAPPPVPVEAPPPWVVEEPTEPGLPPRSPRPPRRPRSPARPRPPIPPSPPELPFYPDPPNPNPPLLPLLPPPSPEPPAPPPPSPKPGSPGLPSPPPPDFPPPATPPANPPPANPPPPGLPPPGTPPATPPPVSPPPSSPPPSDPPPATPPPPGLLPASPDLAPPPPGQPAPANAPNGPPPPGLAPKPPPAPPAGPRFPLFPPRPPRPPRPVGRRRRRARELGAGRQP